MPGPIEGLGELLLGEAARMVEERGWGDVTLRQVARAAGVSYGGPVSRFGDEAGLLAAVAERGFSLLEEELAREASSRPPLGPSAVSVLGLCYVKFALTHRHLHRAMHHPDLWSPAPPRSAPSSPSIARRDARSVEWRARAAAARNACFGRFVAAVIEGQVAGVIADAPPGEIARAVTALADGFILQTTDEAAGAAGGVERQLAVAARLFDRVALGLSHPFTRDSP